MYISHPVFKTKIFLDNSLTKYEDRLEQVLTKVLTSDIITYCEDNARIKNNFQVMSYEYSERILENCATYLLRGQYKENNILNIDQIRKYQTYEIPASASDSNSEDLIYATGFSPESSEKHLTATPELWYNTEVDREKTSLSVSQVNKTNKKRVRQRKRFKQTRSFRMEKLYSTPSVRTYRLEQILVEDENKKKKPFKNVFGQLVYQVVYQEIGGQKGMIDDSSITKWCLVDTENCFSFDGQTYRIDESVEQYKVEEDCSAKMDMIYSIKRKDGTLLFFDQVFCEIPSKKVVQITQLRS